MSPRKDGRPLVTEFPVTATGASEMGESIEIPDGTIACTFADRDEDWMYDSP